MKNKSILAALAATLCIVVVGCKFGVGEFTMKQLEAMTLRTSCAE